MAAQKKNDPRNIDVQKSAFALLDSVVAAGRKAAAGGDIAVAMRAGRSANTRFAQSEITSTGDVEDTELTVSVAFGRRHAACSTNQTDAASLRATVERAARLAKLMPEDPERMPPLGPQRYRASAAIWDAATEKLGADARAAAADTAISRARAANVQIAGFFEHDATAVALATSAGLRAFHRATSARLTMTARTTDGVGSGTGSGWSGATGDRVADLDAGALAAVAIDKAVRSAKPRRLEPGRYTVILEPVAVAELLSFFTGSLDARAADEGRSFFARPGGATRVGERLFPEAITIRSDPADPATPAAPFDAEGFPLEARSFIDRGTLTDLVCTRYWAEKRGRKPTGVPRVFHLLGGTATREELLKGVERGVLITRFWYTRWVDPQAVLITGLTRDGVFLVEKGEVVAPVNNFRWNESPVTMLRNADAITRETVRSPYGNGRLRVPALRTHEFNLASISEAV